MIGWVILLILSFLGGIGSYASLNHYTSDIARIERMVAHTTQTIENFRSQHCVDHQKEIELAAEHLAFEERMKAINSEIESIRSVINVLENLITKEGK